MSRNTFTALIGIAVLAALLLSCSITLAVDKWTPGGVEVRGTGLTGNAQSQQIIPDGSGGAIITWLDYRNGRNDIYAQRVEPGGSCEWAPNGVDVRGPGMAVGAYGFKPALATDGAGGAIIAWVDARGTGAAVYAQRLNSAGEPQWALNGVELKAPPQGAFTCFPFVTQDGSGGAIVGWCEVFPLQHPQPYQQYTILAQRIDSSGVCLWTENGCRVRDLDFVGPWDLYMPSIVPDCTGGAIITWEDRRAGFSDIYAQRLDAAGDPQWAEDGIEVCGTGIDVECRAPIAVSDGTGGAMITWWERFPESYEVFAQRVTADGQGLWATNGINVRGQPYPNGAGRPGIASNGNGGCIVTWMDGRNTTTMSDQCDIYAQKFDPSGAALWSPGGILLTPGGPRYHGYPGIVSNTGGGCYITWHEVENDDLSTQKYFVRTQKVSSTGSTESTAGGDIVRGPEIPGYAAGEVIAPDSHGGAILAWLDTRNGKSDIYTQRVVDPAPTVTSIDPSSGSNLWPLEVTIAGEAFSAGASVRLVRGSTVVEAINVTVVSETSMTCNFNISGQPLGKYDVIVKNPDGQEGKLAAGFAVTDICGQGAAASISVFAASMGLLSVAGIGLRRRRRKK